MGPFRIATGFRPTRVSAWDGFRIATGFRQTQVSARDELRVRTSFGLVNFSVSFQIGFNIFSFFLFRFVSVSVFCFRLVGLFGFVSVDF
ncbi:hypothetical protein Hanom_Chr15g01388251 [Helianthus anomalus]